MPVPEYNGDLIRVEERYQVRIPIFWECQTCWALVADPASHIQSHEGDAND